MISLIVPAHNEEAVLGGTLDALNGAGAAAGVPFEIIVVDDASTDATAAVAGSRGARVVRIDKRHIAAARNAGAAAARFEMLVFVDADTTVPPATLKAAVAALREGAVGGGSRVHLEPHAPRWVRFFWLVIPVFYAGLGLAAGCFLFAHRDRFREAGGFDERYFASEEVHLSRAMRRRGRFVILRETVTTSARKFRMFSPWTILGWLIGLSGGLVRRRHVLWYGGHREAPGASGTSGMSRTQR